MKLIAAFIVFRKESEMHTWNPPPGFQPVRRDRLLQEQTHDTYKTKGKLPEPSVCKGCGAVFDEGRWQWKSVPAGANEALCPACHRIQDRFPAGFVTLEGPYFAAHREEIMHLAHNHERRERQEHPLQRIMAVEERADDVLVTTTDLHLARGIGEAIHDAYQGELAYHYNPDENLLRVHWRR